MHTMILLSLFPFRTIESKSAEEERHDNKSVDLGNQGCAGSQ